MSRSRAAESISPLPAHLQSARLWLPSGIPINIGIRVLPVGTRGKQEQQFWDGDSEQHPDPLETHSHLPAPPARLCGHPKDQRPLLRLLIKGKERPCKSERAVSVPASLRGPGWHCGEAAEGRCLQRRKESRSFLQLIQGYIGGHQGKPTAGAGES